MKRFLFVCFTCMLIAAPLHAVKVAVFCSADNKVPFLFKDISERLGIRIAQKGYTLVTGGSNTGLMDSVGNGYSRGGGRSFIGILPNALKGYNVEHPNISQKIWVDGMHLRLKTFHEHADVVVVLPGGFGTLHETLDFLVHQQFGIIPPRRIIFMNMRSGGNSFWDGFKMQLEQMLADNTITDNHFKMVSFVDSVDACLQLIEKPLEEETDTLDARFWEEE